MPELDLLIHGGVIVDGTGEPAFEANLGITGDRIVYIGPDTPAATRTIDASGRHVTPGFVDTHVHYDAQLVWDPYAAPHSLHGVTSYVCGNCGFTLAPLSKTSSDYLVKMLAKVEGIPQETLDEGLKIDWSTTREMLDRFEGKVGVNVGFMTGHSTLRAYVMGDNAVGGTPTETELVAMKGLLRQALSEGSLGFSSSHAETHTDHQADHVPSYYASHEELLELMSVVPEFEGTFAGYVLTVAHTPSAEEAVKLAEVSLKAQRPYSWPAVFPGAQSRERQFEKLASVDVARKMGADVRIQVQSAPVFLHMNFLTGHTFDQLPGIWPSLYALSPAERIERFKEPATRRAMEAGALEAPQYFRSRLDWAKMRVGSSESPDTARHVGRLIGEIAEECGASPFDAMMDIVIEDRLTTLLMPTALVDDSENAWRDVVAFLRDDRGVWGGDDGGAHVDMIEAYSHGTRFIENAVRKYGLATLEEAIHAFSKRPADFIGLRDRGVLKEGAFADVLVIDLAKVGVGPVELRKDLPAEGRRLYTAALGFDWVIVNGEPIAQAGQYTGALPGKVLRSGTGTYTRQVAGARGLPEVAVA